MKMTYTFGKINLYLSQLNKLILCTCEEMPFRFHITSIFGISFNNSSIEGKDSASGRSRPKPPLLQAWETYHNNPFIKKQAVIHRLKIYVIVIRYFSY